MLKPTVWRQGDWNTEEASFATGFNHVRGEVHTVALVYEFLTALITQQVLAHLYHIEMVKRFILEKYTCSGIEFIANFVC